MGTILVIVAFGFALMLAEMFLPGGVLGVVGGLLLMIAVVLGYVNFGPVTGTMVFAGVGFATLVGFITWLAIFPKTPVGRKLTLGRSLEKGDRVDTPVLEPGTEGVADTPLRPGGKAVFGGRRFEVTSEGDFLDAGEAVVVVRREFAHYVVRKKA